MLKSYLQVALRNFWKQKTFSLINVFGLAIGISASLVIYLLVQYDFNFDKFHASADRIYRVVSDFEFAGEAFHNPGVTSPMGNTLRKEGTGLELVVPFRTTDEDTKVTVPAKGINQPAEFKKQKHFIYTDAAYFNLFNYTWLAGSPARALEEPYQLVLTASLAKKYFPALPVEQIPGNELLLNDSLRFTVSGVVQELAKPTDFNFTAFASRATLATARMKPENEEDWNSTNSASQLLVRLSPGSTAADIEKKLQAIGQKYRKQEKDDHSKTSYHLQPLSDIHFNAQYGVYGDRQAHKPTLYGLLAVAAFLLLLGCINFINLTTAQASQRAKEIGIRKTMGSSRRQLMGQFLSETFLVTSVATLLSIVLTPFLLKVFADFIPADLRFDIARQPGIMIFLVLLVLAVTLLSGFYPAVLLSAFKPVAVLKNQWAGNAGKTRNAFLRKTLTVAQFVIAQVFIIATLLISKQINYTLHKDLGFRKDAILFFTINYRDTAIGKRAVLKEKISSMPGVQRVAMSNTPPSSNNVWSSTMKYKDGKKEIETDVQIKIIDTAYLKLYAIPLLAGSNLPNSDTTTGMVINQTYARLLGFSRAADAIGQTIEWNNKQVPITGVSADFHQRSLHEVIKPLAMVSNKKQCRTINVLLQPMADGNNNWKASIAAIEKATRQLYPADDVDIKFLDENIAKFYTSEQHIASLLLWATGLAIAISCLGLLGLIIYITHQRTKEIGIRKVIGASIAQLVTLLSVDFLKLVAVAFLIAVPLAWWCAHKWLQNFAYRTSISWWVFALGGLVMFAMAMLVLGVRTFKAANANPVDSLRTE
ncbi:MAG TPA: ABC transporter permease [Chitinophagaceae bacterium]|nr:ABC transporter permease [Chitinophagaceae bacterium]